MSKNKPEVFIIESLGMNDERKNLISELLQYCLGCCTIQ